MFHCQVASYTPIPPDSTLCGWVGLFAVCFDELELCGRRTSMIVSKVLRHHLQPPAPEIVSGFQVQEKVRSNVERPKSFLQCCPGEQREKRSVSNDDTGPANIRGHCLSDGPLLFAKN